MATTTTTTTTTPTTTPTIDLSNSDEDMSQADYDSYQEDMDQIDAQMDKDHEEEMQAELEMSQADEETQADEELTQEELEEMNQADVVTNSDEQLLLSNGSEAAEAGATEAGATEAGATEAGAAEAETRLPTCWNCTEPISGPGFIQCCKNWGLCFDCSPEYVAAGSRGKCPCDKRLPHPEVNAFGTMLEIHDFAIRMGVEPQDEFTRTNANGDQESIVKKTMELASNKIRTMEMKLGEQRSRNWHLQEGYDTQQEDLDRQVDVFINMRTKITQLENLNKQAADKIQRLDKSDKDKTRRLNNAESIQAHATLLYQTTLSMRYESDEKLKAERVEKRNLETDITKLTAELAGVSQNRALLSQMLAESNSVEANRYAKRCKLGGGSGLDPMDKTVAKPTKSLTKSVTRSTASDEAMLRENLAESKSGSDTDESDEADDSTDSDYPDPVTI